MSERWWRRKKKKDPWFSDVYEELQRLGYLIDETIQNAFENFSDKKVFPKSRFPVFSTKLDTEGKPRIREFFNHNFRQNAKINDNPEPLVDLIEDAENIIVVASLPGVKKEAIGILATKNRLTVSVDTPNLGCHKELKLPTRVDPKAANASLKNGVLEIKLKKLKRSTKNDKISVKK